MEQAVANWVRLAKPDVRAARVLLEADDPENALYFCQQAVEKALKALIQEQSGELPPKIHRLLRLAEQARVWDKMGAEHQSLLIALNPLLTLTRYPPDPRCAGSEHPDSADEMVTHSEEVVEWLLSCLQSRT